MKESERIMILINHLKRSKKPFFGVECVTIESQFLSKLLKLYVSFITEHNKKKKEKFRNKLNKETQKMIESNKKTIEGAKIFIPFELY